jgi:aldose sugar dehydrogenase
MAFLPDNRLLVTERSGNLRILDTDNRLTKPLQGTPSVFARGQGGLLDVALAPDGSIYVLTDEENGKILRLSPQR